MKAILQFFTKNVLLLIFIVLFFQQKSTLAQTILQTGDLAVVGVNANNSACGLTNGEDIISFICFKDIETGTTIDLTDNGWERAQDNRWGNSEGAMRITRTGASIPAGTTITMRLPGVGGSFEVLTPDNNWTNERLNAPNQQNVNLNAGGDQLFFLQGGIWDNGVGSLSVDYEHDATYSGGRLLFGVNTAGEWNPMVDEQGASGLPVDIVPCYSAMSTNGFSSFLSYTGPTAATHQLDWILRIDNPDNWTDYADCASYQPPVAQFDITPPTTSLSCTECVGCAPLDEKLAVQLPQTGGPFNLTYLLDGAPVRVTGLSNNDSIPLNLTQSASILLRSISDEDGCAIYPEVDMPIDIAVSKVPVATPAGPLSSCSTSGDTAVFVLSSLESEINPAGTGSVYWFTDSSLLDTLSTPNNFTSVNTTVYAVITENDCTSEAVAIELQALPAPTVSISEGATIADDECHTFDIDFTGSGSYSLTYSILTENNPDQNQILNSSLDTADLSICPADFGITNGEIRLLFQLVEDGSCPLPLDEERIVRICQPARDTIRDTLCTGDAIVVNRRVYDAGRPNGTEIIEGVAANGCDSIIEVNLTFLPAVTATLTGDARLCQGDSTLISVQMQGATTFDLQLENSLGEQLSFTDLGNSFQFSVKPVQTVRYWVAGISPAGVSCRQHTATDTVEVAVSELNLEMATVSDYGGVQVSCAGAQDGFIDLGARGNFQPLQYRWSNNSTAEDQQNISAGTYTVTITDDNACTIQASFQLNEPPALQVTTTTQAAICTDTDDGAIEISTISGGSGPYQYELNGGTFQNIGPLPFTISGLSPGNYNMSVQDVNGCPQVFALFINSAAGLTLDLGPDQTIGRGDSTQIDITLDFAPERFVWDKTDYLQFIDSLTILARPPVTTTYQLTAINGVGCSLTDQVTIFVEERMDVYAPQAFSPNEDGINDRFVLFAGTDVELIKTLNIYDRWGNLLFEQTDIAPGADSNGWDGTHQGQDKESGIYVFIAELQLRDGSELIQSGDFLLIR